MLRKIALGLLLVLLSPLIIVLIALAMVAVLALQVYGWFALHQYCRRHGCWTFLICSSRHGWHEFLANNVLAALPQGVEPVWVNSGGHTGASQEAAPFSLRVAGAGLAKPCLARVKTIGVKTRSLHGRLLPLKTCAKKDADLQQLLRRMLAAELVDS
jgi:hypothetical protein